MTSWQGSLTTQRVELRGVASRAKGRGSSTCRAQARAVPRASPDMAWRARRASSVAALAAAACAAACADARRAVSSSSASRA